MGMKIRSIKYILKEGFLNAYRNKMMSLASISIISAALVLFGIFYLILINLNHNLDALSKQPQMEAFCLPELTDDQVNSVEYEIKSNSDVGSYKKVSKKEAFEKLKKYLETDKDMKDGSNVLEGYDESIMNVSFVVTLKNPQNSSRVANQLRSLAGIETVRYSQETIDMITYTSNWIKLVSGVLITILQVISLFIISNTIKLTVFARRKEINIMKYIGATDWFIRWPFIFEGVIIGIIGALIAFFLVAYIYNLLEPRVTKNLVTFGNEFAIMGFRSIWARLISFYCIISVLIGSLGSVISVRKHLKV
jgi:cell division transport system permease protein